VRECHLSGTKFMQEWNDMHRKTRNSIAAALLATTVLGGAAAYAVAPDAAAAPPVGTAQVVRAPDFADLVERVRPAVVNIAVTERAKKLAMDNIPEPFRRYFRDAPQGKPRQGVGSGFIIDPEGWIVTNNHVVDGAEKVVITLEDGSELPAVVKGRDPKTDVALLKVEASRKLPYVAWGDSDKAREGEWVVAVGNPFGLGGSVTAGIISARGRHIGAGPYDDFIQIDAPINPGNSGGPLFDQSGRVIGISTAIFSPTGSSVGIGFAVPSAIAKNVVAQLKEDGAVERGWLGVSLQSFTPELAKAMGRSVTAGALISSVTPDSPAAKAGLEQGDVVTGVGGKEIKTTRDLARIVGDTKPGQKLDLTVARGGGEKKVSVTIGELQEERVAEAGAQLGEEGGPKIGLALAPITPQARVELGLDSNVKGAVVARILPESPAAKSGLRPGDVILRVAGETVDGPEKAVGKLRAAQAEKKEAVPLLVMREGTPYYLALDLKQA
jgi:serine protease Do